MAKEAAALAQAEHEVAQADRELQQVEKSISKAQKARWKAFGDKTKERFAGTALGAKPEEKKEAPAEKSLAELTAEQDAEHAAKQENETPEQKAAREAAKPEEKKEEPKKKGFVQTQKEQAAQAAKDAQEFRQKYETAEAARSALEVEKADLQKRIDDSTSNPEIVKLQEQLREKEQYAETILKEKTVLEKNQEFLDTVNSPVFKKNYVEPLQTAYSSVADVLNQDPDALQELGKAINAQEAAMGAKTPEERLRQENIRDQIINGIYDNLIPSKQGLFTGLFYNGLLPKQTQHFMAFQDRQKTVEENNRETERLRIEKNTNFKNTWSGAFEKAGKVLDAEITYPEDVARIIKENKIDDSVDSDMAIAKDLVIGGTKYSPEEGARIMVQGANANRYKAQLKAKDIIISEQEETIKKFRATNTNGNGTHEANNDPEKDDKPVKGSRQWALDRWGVNR